MRQQELSAIEAGQSGRQGQDTLRPLGTIQGGQQTPVAQAFQVIRDMLISPYDHRGHIGSQDDFLNDTADIPPTQPASPVTAEQNQAYALSVGKLNDAFRWLTLQEHTFYLHTGLLQSSAHLPQVGLGFSLVDVPIQWIHRLGSACGMRPLQHPQ
jgi:hypothetical protein